MNWKNYVDATQQLKPFLKDTGQSVEQIFEQLSHGASTQEILNADPRLTDEHLRVCYVYVQELIPDWFRRRHTAGEGKIHVGRKALQGAFARHRQAGAGGITDSGLLLLVYAAECGLKRLLLQRRSYHSTEKLDEDDLTHHLDRLLEKLRGRPSFNNILLHDGRHISADRLHEALRYGVRLQDRERILKIVEETLDWIEEEIQ